MSEQRTASLSSAFGEVLTAITRVRYRQGAVTDADAFRAHIRGGLQAPMHQARNMGYRSEYVQSAVFAVVALLDESVLNLQDPAFAQWARRPLQEELFGGHLAGETFFRNLRVHLQEQDSAHLADLLEVYCLCMLLGYRGRHALGSRGELFAELREARDRIHRIRGDLRLAADTSTAPETMPRSTSRLNVVLLSIACALAALLGVAYIGFGLALSSGAAAIRGLGLHAL